jgi:ribonuclease P/MRP protein subunit RPP40
VWLPYVWGSLETCQSERDLGITLFSDLKVGIQCQQAYSKASRMFGVMKRTIEYKIPEVMLCLYKALVCPHLEYSVSAWWSPRHYTKDKKLLEKVQQRFTKLISGLQNLSYENRLEKLGLWTLEERRNRADLIEVLKMAHGLSGVALNTLFELDTIGRTRGHCFKLVKHRCCKDIRRFFFSQRVVSKWNSLEEMTVTAKTVNSFKSNLEHERRMKMGLFLD